MALRMDLTAPTAGTVVDQGQNFTITWIDYLGSQQYEVQISTGGAFSRLGVTNAQSFVWSVQTAPTTQAVIRVIGQDAQGTFLVAVDSPPFTIRARTLTVTEPAAGQVVAPGQPLTIRWQTSTAAAEFDVQLSTGGGPFATIVRVAGAARSVVWRVAGAAGDQAVIRVVALDATGAALVSGDSGRIVILPARVSMRVLVHLQGIGDQTFRDGDFAGTRGQSRRLEGFQLDLDPPLPGIGLRYFAHLQNLGDTGWVTDGSYAGTRGQSRRLEGLAIEVTGPAAPYYDVSYMAHLQDIGDTPHGRNGDFVGSRGQSRRVEGIEVTLQVPAPRVRLDGLVHLQSLGDEPFHEAEFAGTRGQSRRLEGFLLRFSQPIPGLSMRYFAHLQNVGDTPWVPEGQFVGTRGQSRRLEGFAIELTGPDAPNWHVRYMAHVQNLGDVPTVQDGQFCGTRGQSLRLEGLRVEVVHV